MCTKSFGGGVKQWDHPTKTTSKRHASTTAGVIWEFSYTYKNGEIGVLFSVYLKARTSVLLCEFLGLFNEEEYMNKLSSTFQKAAKRCKLARRWVISPHLSSLVTVWTATFPEESNHSLYICYSFYSQATFPRNTTHLGTGNFLDVACEARGFSISLYLLLTNSLFIYGTKCYVTCLLDTRCKS